MFRQNLLEQDLENITRYLDVRDKNPCPKCLGNTAACCGCESHKTWLEQLHKAELPIIDIDPEARMLWEQWCASLERTARYTRALEEERAVQQQLMLKLSPYLKRQDANAQSPSAEEPADTV